MPLRSVEDGGQQRSVLSTSMPAGSSHTPLLQLNGLTKCRKCARSPALRREDAEDRVASTAAPQVAGPVRCLGWDGVPCDRPALPTRSVCARHRVHQLAVESEAC